MRVTKANPYKKVRKPNARTAVPKTKKSFFECIGGPYNGKHLFLTDGNTLPFTINGQSGKYMSSTHSTSRTVWCPNVNH